jgi:hypothetical protein
MDGFFDEWSNSRHKDREERRTEAKDRLRSIGRRVEGQMSDLLHQPFTETLIHMARQYLHGACADMKYLYGIQSRPFVDIVDDGIMYGIKTAGKFDSVLVANILNMRSEDVANRNLLEVIKNA